MPAEEKYLYKTLYSTLSSRAKMVIAKQWWYIAIGAAGAARAAGAASTTGTETEACTRDLLERTAAQYIEAQTAGTPKILRLAPNASYVENDAALDVGSGVLSQAITIDLHRSIYDTQQCIAFTELTAATNAHPYVIDTRLTLRSDEVVSIDSVVADTGDWVFNATAHLRWAALETWSAIPEEERDTRAVVQAAGDAYLDSWRNGSVQVPYGTPCARIEGGLYTGEGNSSANTCTMPEFPAGFAGIDRRRYAIDVELGAMAIFNNFPFIDVERPNGTQSMNFFRIEGGKIRYIHETTVCSTPGCGR